MSSFAADQTRQLVKALDSYPITAKSITAQDNKSRDEEYRQALSDLRSEINGPTIKPAELADALTRHAPTSFENGDNDLNDFEALFWVNATIEAYGSVLEDLIARAANIQEEIEYWKKVEELPFTQSYYLLQTGPIRAARLAKLLAQRAQTIPRNLEQGGSWSVARFKQLCPPSLLICCLFPHLSTAKMLENHDPASFDTSVAESNRLLSWSYSPWLLASQEAQGKRKALQAQLSSVASRIGTIATYLQSDPVRDSLAEPSLPEVAAAVRAGLHAADGNTIRPNGVPNGSGDAQDRTLAQHAINLLTVEYPKEVSVISETIKHHARPSALVRHWPRLVLIPAGAYIIATQAYASRDKLWELWNSAQETARGFFVDWVIDPCIKILDTVRHGDDSLALMGKASLDSDLDSLERMVIDFDREVYGYKDAELLDAGRRVREGDLTEVLKVWEENIKSPIKSAAFGSLVRTLMIQVQKVKVDVDLAMNGIEKMLKSQQLTFAFVGVAPSLLVLFGAVRWLRGSFNLGASQRMRRGKSSRRRVWLALRTVDKLLQPDEPSFDHLEEPKEEQNRFAANRLGSILVQLQILRTFADSKTFPSKDRAIQQEFIYDIRQLETATDVTRKRRMMTRFWQIWSLPLGFSSIM